MRLEVLLFDELPALSTPKLVGEVLAVMKGLADESRTMAVVTHEMGFAREAADEVVFMDGGRIVDVAPPEQFSMHPKSEWAREFLQHFR